MTLLQALKAILTGLCFGVGLVWLLALIIPFAFGLDAIRFIRECNDEIASMSMFSGSVSIFAWLILSAIGRKRRKREELEDAMTEYFRKQNEKNS